MSAESTLTDETEEFLGKLEQSAMLGRNFLTTDIPKRPPFISDWFCQGDQGFVFGPRGAGKTWFAHMLLASTSTAQPLGPWTVHQPVRTLLVDGEMPPDATQARLAGLGANGDGFFILNHQFLFDKGDTSFQLASGKQRAALLEFCVRYDIEMMILDNLSTLCGIAENDNDEWPVIGNWLLEFRRRKISVVVVHHAGRNGEMRGASRREDPAFWIIRVNESRDATQSTPGAKFTTTFTKCRNAAESPTPIEWHMTPDGNRITPVYREADNQSQFLACVSDGITSCSDIAEEIGMTKGSVSKMAHRLAKLGKIRITGPKTRSTYEIV